MYKTEYEKYKIWSAFLQQQQSRFCKCCLHSSNKGLNLFRATSSSKYMYKALEPAGWFFRDEMPELCWQSHNAAEQLRADAALQELVTLPQAFTTLMASWRQMRLIRLENDHLSCFKERFKMYKYYIFICICPITHIICLSTPNMAYQVEASNSGIKPLWNSA